jgi:glycolate oxidase iron-sulfur subunit
VERNLRRSLRQRAIRRFIFALFTHPGRMRAAAVLLAASRALRLDRALRRGRGLHRLPTFRALTRLAPSVRVRDATVRLRETTPARGAARGRIGLLQGCVQRVFFHDVNAATARVLSAEGFEVYAPKAPRCCGALLMHSGYEPEAIRLAKETIVAFEGCDVVAVNAAGCGSAMKGYVHLLEDDPRWGERARAFSARVRDVSELLAERGTVAARHPVSLRVAYHDACHLAHAQAIRDQPRALLREVPGLELLEPEEWEICCGSAGIYNILEPEAGEELGRRKAKNLLATGADAVAAGNPGCVLQIASHFEEMGRPLPVYHPMEILDASISGRRL